MDLYVRTNVSKKIFKTAGMFEIMFAEDMICIVIRYLVLYYINHMKIIITLTCEKYCNLMMVRSTANIYVLYDVSNTGCISEIVDQNLLVHSYC